MTRATCAILWLLVLTGAVALVVADETKTYTGAACTAAAPVDEFFVNEVWVKVGAHKCLECHKSGGDAEESDFILLDPTRVPAADREKILRHNREQFAAMAKTREGDQSRLLLKPLGKLKHGGKEQLKSDSAGYAVLADFVRRVTVPPTGDALARAMGHSRN